MLKITYEWRNEFGEWETECDDCHGRGYEDYDALELAVELGYIGCRNITVDEMNGGAV